MSLQGLQVQVREHGHVLGFKIFLHLPNSLRALSYAIEHNSNCLVVDFNIEQSFLISTILLLLTWLSCGELCCDPSDPLIIVGAQENTVYIDVTVEGKPRNSVYHGATPDMSRLDC